MLIYPIIVNSLPFLKKSLSTVHLGHLNFDTVLPLTVTSFL